MGRHPRGLGRRIRSLADEPPGASRERLRAAGIFAGNGLSCSDAAVLSQRIRVCDPHRCREIRRGRVCRQPGYTNSVGMFARARRTEPTPSRSCSGGGGRPSPLCRKLAGSRKVRCASVFTGVERARDRSRSRPQGKRGTRASMPPSIPRPWWRLRGSSRWLSATLPRRSLHARALLETHNREI